MVSCVFFLTQGPRVGGSYWGLGLQSLCSSTRSLVIGLCSVPALVATVPAPPWEGCVLRPSPASVEVPEECTLSPASRTLGGATGGAQSFPPSCSAPRAGPQTGEHPGAKPTLSSCFRLWGRDSRGLLTSFPLKLVEFALNLCLLSSAITPAWRNCVLHSKHHRTFYLKWSCWVPFPGNVSVATMIAYNQSSLPTITWEQWNTDNKVNLFRNASPGVVKANSTECRLILLLIAVYLKLSSKTSSIWTSRSVYCIV